jgi:hypothetical protein
MLRTVPTAVTARSAATRVAGLPQPLTRAMPRLAMSAPASPARLKASDPGSALPSTLTWGRRMDTDMVFLVRPNVGAKRGKTAERQQARAGKNVVRTARPGLVACRWC